MIKVLKAGFYSSIQDLGRFGFREKGVPVSGVMDSNSAQWANMLLNNHREDALIEMTMTGAELYFEDDTEIAIAGADMSPELNGQSISALRGIFVQKGDTLKFKSAKDGFRTYVAVKGGFQTPFLLGSRSYYKPITVSNRLNAGDLLSTLPLVNEEKTFAHIRAKQEFNAINLEVYKGPEWDLIGEEALLESLKKTFSVASNNNRMAYQLEEKSVSHQFSILTAGTVPGTVQLTPAGTLIVLMKDVQTTGGYPRILQLTDDAISHLSQKQTGNKIKFVLRS